MPEQLVPTPGQTVGPFFHDAQPFERGAELVPRGSAGAVRLHGVVYDGSGQPVPDALVEIRQADSAGRVPLVEGSLSRTGAFSGWGRAATDSVGRYSFVTVEPGPVGPDAPAFFSVVVFARGLLNRLFTRAYLPGPNRAGDGLLARLTPEQRQTMLVTREEGGGLRFDIRLQGAEETVFLTFPGHGPQ